MKRKVPDDKTVSKQLTPQQRQTVYTILVVIILLSVACLFFILLSIEESENTTGVVYIPPEETPTAFASVNTSDETDSQQGSDEETTTSRTAVNQAPAATTHGFPENPFETPVTDVVYEDFPSVSVATTSEMVFPSAPTTEIVSDTTSLQTSTPATSSTATSSSSTTSYATSLPAASLPTVSAPTALSLQSKIQAIERAFFVDLMVVTQDTPKVGYTAFQNLTTADRLLTDLTHHLQALSSDVWQQLTHRHAVSITLCAAASHTTASVSATLQQQTIHFTVIGQAGFTDLAFEFGIALSQTFDVLLQEQGLLQQSYQNFASHNPADFSYGTYHPTSLSSNPQDCYFLNILSQSAITTDRHTLFATYCTNGLPANLLTANCPVYHKLNVLLSDYNAI